MSSQKVVARLAFVYFFVWSQVLARLDNLVPVGVEYTHRDVKDQHLPSSLNVTIRTPTQTAELQLEQVEHIHLGIPVYSLKIDQDGELIRTKEILKERKNVGYYQDIKNNAVIQVSKPQDSNSKKDKLLLKGEITLGGSKYFIDSKKQIYKTGSATQEEEYSLEPRPQQDAGQCRSLELQLNETIKIKRQNLSVVSSAYGSQHKSINRTTQTTNTKRHRRQASVTYYIDVVAVVDNGAYQRFLSQANNDRQTAFHKLQEYYAFIFNGVDMLYRDIWPEYEIRVRLNAIHVAETLATSEFTEKFNKGGQVDAEKAISAFKVFCVVKANWLLRYDHAMLFTGYDLTSVEYYGVSKSIVGLAYTTTMCQKDGTSVSIIEDMGGYEAIHTATHELGHSLSARHDGEGNTCRLSDRYIMAASSYNQTDDNRYNPWQFSRCSKSYINGYINQLVGTQRAQCLIEKQPISEVLPYVDQRLLGQELPPDEQCKQIYGAKSFYCRTIEAGGNAGVCTSLYCADPGDLEMCYRTEALHGTTCGDRRMCVSGHCVTHPKAQHVDESCVFGDVQGQPFNGRSCRQLISTFPGYCYQHAVKVSCCASCAAVFRPVRACEYGDVSTGCQSTYCQLYDEPMHCCGTCQLGQPYPQASLDMTVCSDSQDFVLPGGLKCPDVLQGNKHLCYQQTIRERCCSSCSVVSSGVRGCEYGDHAPWMCEAHRSCDTNRDLCCVTCASTASINFRYHVELWTLKLSLHGLAMPLIAILFSRIIYNS
ncbi:A disintegrin and metalloproteinase with thrombospondin motifs like isoform X3 [Physella acuta]|uniref:A disintegrin and metalloproteinase with thrombospondin motifs like isoform X3 n=1 Tax=Physella acuta TaxID=109671 RepID=UPI0027DC2777|nr:A disintegrin and metalloproteinase with thrombospondin motifs like isoform X3 [Physella acuta]